MKKVTIAVIGAGCRGMYAYAPYLLENPNLGKIVAVAEPIKEKRDLFKKMYSIEDNCVFENWEELLKQDKLADGIIIANNDEEHYLPAKIAIEKGYHILLEKPISNKLEDIIKLESLSKKYENNIMMICHVLRYTPFFNEIKKIIDSRKLGELISIQHNENIGYWHFAHSYTRGNWRNSEATSPLILAKSCHDIDILLWLTGKKCINVASFGSLTHMQHNNFKANMSERCVSCNIEKDCPYSAIKIYLKDNKISSSLNAVHSNPTKENLANAIIDGPYGQCVYKCDNNVVDHMVSIFEFDNGITATFNLSAFTKECTRTIKLMFTHGEVGGNHMNNIIDVYKFGDNYHRVIKPNTRVNGHGGGDYGLIKDFIELISSGEGDLRTSISQSIDSHIIAFALENSRINKKVVNISNYIANI